MSVPASPLQCDRESSAKVGRSARNIQKTTRLCLKVQNQQKEEEMPQSRKNAPMIGPEGAARPAGAMPGRATRMASTDHPEAPLLKTTT